MGDLDADTRVDGRDGRYTIMLSRDWEIWGPNGGYLAAVALRAAGMESRIKRPASISCHFLSVARFEPVEIAVNAVQRGRRAESFHVTMTQAGRPVLQAIVRNAAPGEGVRHDVSIMPDVPPPDTLKSFLEHWPDAPEGPRFWGNFDSRLIRPERIFRQAPNDPDFLEWYRFQPRECFDDPFVDAGRYLILIDTFAWPAAAGPHDSTARAVNLDVTAWFHRLAPDSRWLLCDYDSPLAEDGLAAGQGRVWSENGRLLATGGAQLLCIPAPATLAEGPQPSATHQQD